MTTVLPVTEELTAGRSRWTQPTPPGWRSMVADALVRDGSGADATALLPLFLTDPRTYARLVPVLARHGDTATARQLLDACVTGGRLREGAPSQVLHAIGYLGYEPAERILWEHVEGPYDEARDACLGLLHLPCRELAGEIGATLERHLGEALFPEFLPVLVTKTGDPEWLEKLDAWGEIAASTDCNGGLILGIALHGPPARRFFTDLLWNPVWEADGVGTGSSRWAYTGARVLGLDMAGLYGGLQTRLASDADTATRRHCLAVFAALLSHWSERRWFGVRLAPDPAETCTELYEQLFTQSSAAGQVSLIDRAHQVVSRDDPLYAQLYQLADGIEIRAAHELALRNRRSR